MILGTGTDLVGVDRVQRALAARHGARFRARVFSPAEISYCETRGKTRAESYAARFAAKEGVMKALGVGWGREADWQGIEVLRDSQGCPRVQLQGSAARRAESLGIEHIHLSLAHAGGFALAFVIAEG